MAHDLSDLNALTRRAMDMARRAEACRDRVNLMVTCKYCGGDFAAKGRRPNCIHCGAPMKVAKSSP